MRPLGGYTTGKGRHILFIDRANGNAGAFGTILRGTAEHVQQVTFPPGGKHRLGESWPELLTTANGVAVLQIDSRTHSRHIYHLTEHRLAMYYKRSAFSRLPNAGWC